MSSIDYTVVDNFFPNEVCYDLRKYALDLNVPIDNQYNDYISKEFDHYPNPHSFPKIHSSKHISELISEKVSLVQSLKYDRSWCFVYDNIARGVHPHADPSSNLNDPTFITVNTWITPDSSVDDTNKNGLILYEKTADGMSPDLYNNPDINIIKDFLKDSEYVRIPYKYNRAVIFKSHHFHTTDNVHMKPGHQNRRISYTFLYNK
tara:strand:+ start:207 stop:821 length:615 start_codon:yes stop_codon:yes gene_type:complete